MDDIQLLKDALPWLIPIFILEIALLIISLIDIDRRKCVTGNNKIVWFLVVILISIIGPVIYFIFGRKNKAEKNG